MNKKNKKEKTCTLTEPEWDLIYAALEQDTLQQNDINYVEDNEEIEEICRRIHKGFKRK